MYQVSCDKLLTCLPLELSTVGSCRLNNSQPAPSQPTQSPFNMLRPAGLFY